MKLMDLLEQGKKATRKELYCDYIYTDDVNGTFAFDGNEFVEMYNIGLSDLTRNDWYEYGKYKTNFEFKEGMDDAYIIDNAEIYPLPCLKQNHYEGYIKNFNAFPNKELAEFINKKQLLERELMAFSYLNGSDEIDWKDYNTAKYYIEYDKDTRDKRFTFTISKNYMCKRFDSIYFKSREICEKASELYKENIEEVLELSMKFGF